MRFIVIAAIWTVLVVPFASAADDVTGTDAAPASATETEGTTAPAGEAAGGTDKAKKPATEEEEEPDCE